MDTEANVRWMSWRDSLSEELGENTAVIQILNPGMSPFQIGARRQLVLSFWNRSTLTFGETVIARLFGRRPDLCVKLHKMFLGDSGGGPWRPPLKADAIEIRQFVDAVPKEWSFVVTCEYGRSSSRAVASWIAAHRKLKIGSGRAGGSANVLISDLLFSGDRQF